MEEAAASEKAEEKKPLFDDEGEDEGLEPGEPEPQRKRQDGHRAWAGLAQDRQHIVVHDPSGEFWDGGVVDAQRAEILGQRGGVVLPCDPVLFRKSGVGGFMKRAWGAGWPLEAAASESFCPITLWAEVTHRRVHWAARLIPSPGPTTGFLRLIGLPSHASGWSAPVQAEGGGLVSANTLGDPDEDGGWTVGGRGVVQLRGPGFYDFALYGMMPGVRCVWLAASLAQSGT
jgi:hypothetical protein